ncbi:MAG: L-serine ammonia-lyase [Rhodospirillaceae bacterium]|nr:L-serine ammonia-lyase [Rhodospirillaceae bacterium]MDE0000632.1 L-serine ammonia-lyase [Rhodospirillaceae bacterium]MDE0360705.1 L-serine ammonia-lyase [Rhodospirillaceae bacterium]
MAISTFDLFKIGIGPSSSHTVGPMRAAAMFVRTLKDAGALRDVVRVRADMYGSLGATGRGHGTPKAVMLGLEGERPEYVDVAAIPRRIEAIRRDGSLRLNGDRPIEFHESTDLLLHRRENLPLHANGMRFTAYGDLEGANYGTADETAEGSGTGRNGDPKGTADLDGTGELLSRIYYSVGGGFVLDESGAGIGSIVEDARRLRYPFTTAAELLAHCDASRLGISGVMLANELAWRPEAETRYGLLRIWEAMQECVDRGCRSEGVLPGGLKLPRRAPKLHGQLLAKPEASLSDPLTALDWVTLYALAVNEENAAGGRVVTAPTNGAAGIVPAVLHYYARFVPGAGEDGVVRFLLTAAAIGVLFKENASISGAEVGCQGEVGSACSMAAGGLAEVLGGTPRQVENAAEIAMEHNLGLTCDPVGGLVQVPCIERNAMASIKAIHAARLAMRGDGQHFVSLDQVIKTLRDTGRDMKDKYKETSRGGLAVNVIEIPVNVIEC